VFETEYDVDMKDVLRSIGYPVDSTFNGVGSSTEGDIVMTRVLHKTFIRVDAKGTKAGAVTSVEMAAGGMPTFVEVDLDRPFVYMIVEEQHKVPLFIGVMKDLEE
jgi:serpin B